MASDHCIKSYAEPTQGSVTCGYGGRVSDALRERAPYAEMPLRARTGLNRQTNKHSRQTYSHGQTHGHAQTDILTLTDRQTDGNTS